jgi:hypothetical protein
MIIGLAEWLKWYSTYLASLKPSVQTPLSTTKKKLNQISDPVILIN